MTIRLFFDIITLVGYAIGATSVSSPCKNQRKINNAGMAELADAHGSGPCESNFMQVQVLLPAPSEDNPNLLPVGDGFGFVFFYAYPNFNSKVGRYRN